MSTIWRHPLRSLPGRLARLGLACVALGGLVLAQHGHETARLSVIPADPETIDAAAVADAVTSTPLTPPHVAASHGLVHVQVHPLPEATRVILRFQPSPPPFTLTLDETNGRASLELFDAGVGYFPPELTRLDDTRLRGIWIRRQNDGQVSLDLRLASPQSRLEYFSLDEPATIVIDIFRLDRPWREIASGRPVASQIPEYVPSQPMEPAPPEAVATPAPAVARVAPHGSILPASWLVTETSATPEPAVPGLQYEPEQSPESLSIELAEKSMTPLKDRSKEAALTAAAEALSTGYDGFPLRTMQLTSDAGRELYAAFEVQRWGAVIEQGLEILKTEPAHSREASFVLYMMAEARWRLYRQNMTALPDAANFYEQAWRNFNRGDLGAFGHYRIAQIRERMLDYTTALAHAREAEAASNPWVNYQALRMQARALKELNRKAECLATLDKTIQASPTAELLVEDLLAAGSALERFGEYQKAWDRFTEAQDLDRQWMQWEPGAAAAAARASAALGRNEESLEIVQFILQHYPDNNTSDRLLLILLEAQLHEKLGQNDEAEDIYAMYLSNAENIPGVEALRHKLFEIDPGKIGEAEQRYAELLFHEGEIRRAMAELTRAYRQSIAEGIDAKPLQPLFEKITPAFMRRSVEGGWDFDAIEAWSANHTMLRKLDTRIKCLASLAEALEASGLNDGALSTVRTLKPHAGLSGAPSAGLLDLAEARLLVKKGEALAGINILERLAAGPLAKSRGDEIDAWLALAYEAEGRNLEAAQAWQSLSRAPGKTPTQRAELWIKAATLFEANGMPTQTREICLQALALERELTRRSPGELWDETAGNALRRLLARSCQDGGDDRAAALAWDHYLTRPGLDAGSIAEARMGEAASLWRLDQPAQAQNLYETVVSDETTPAEWKRLAQTHLESMAWDEEYPFWAVGRPTAVNTPAKGSQP